MSDRNEHKKIEMRVLPDGSRNYVVVMDSVKSPAERKVSERRTRDADLMAKALFGH